MRRLWITRRKAAAACLAKMKVYIEDPENGDTTINSFPCRKLGELKNGQKRSFEIGTKAARVFVVADSLSRNLYNEFADIPAGEEDVVLSGKNVLKPFSGNPFRFDGAVSDAVRENRDRVSRRGAISTIAAIVSGVAIGIGAAFAVASGSSMTVAPQTFSAQELQITLTEAFAETEIPGYTACFSAGDTAVFILREDMEQMKAYGNMSLEVYGAMILANNGFDQSVQLEEEGGLTTFSSLRGEGYYYYCGLFRSEDAYWMVQITTTADQPEERIPLFRQWLMSVRFNV